MSHRPLSSVRRPRIRPAQDAPAPPALTARPRVEIIRFGPGHRRTGGPGREPRGRRPDPLERRACPRVRARVHASGVLPAADQPADRAVHRRERGRLGPGRRRATSRSITARPWPGRPASATAAWTDGSRDARASSSSSPRTVRSSARRCRVPSPSGSVDGSSSVEPARGTAGATPRLARRSTTRPKGSPGRRAAVRGPREAAGQPAQPVGRASSARTAPSWPSTRAVAPQTRCRPTGTRRSGCASRRGPPRRRSMGAPGRKVATGTRRSSATSRSSGARAGRRLGDGQHRDHEEPRDAHVDASSVPSVTDPGADGGRGRSPPAASRSAVPAGNVVIRLALAAGQRHLARHGRGSPAGRTVSTTWASPSGPGRAARARRRRVWDRPRVAAPRAAPRVGHPDRVGSGPRMTGSSSAATRGQVASRSCEASPDASSNRSFRGASGGGHGSGLEARQRLRRPVSRDSTQAPGTPRGDAGRGAAPPLAPRLR